MAYRYTSSSHQFREQLYQTAQRCHITSSLNQLRNENILCDVTIAVTNRTFPAHKAVLVASSEYFRAMFTSNLAESKQDKVSLYDVDAGAIEALIDYAYSNKVMFCCYIILLMCY